MTDRELLTLAAKAAGVELSFYNGYAVNVTDFHPAQNVYGAKQWNPLTDDGDALRLAVKLRLSISTPANDVRGNLITRPLVNSQDLKKGVSCNEGETVIDDTYAATRRAIVRAAAQIGKEMK